jgi:NAD(P)-dependent dehydrogenase (short-subunit alcohol dehydrogenase family)
MNDLTGKVAVVTGGTRGIGRAIAEGFARAGADVVIASRKLEDCESTALAITADTGRRAIAVSTNVSHWDACDQLVEQVYGSFGRCDVLVNNAGLSPLYGADLTAVTEALYDKTHNVNVRGAFRLSALLGSRMSQGDGGSIINVSSTGSYHPGSVSLPYEMAKAALNAMTVGLVAAYSPKVRTNTVVPGAYATDVTKAWPEGMSDRVAKSNPMGRIGRPEDMVGICVFLASGSADYINGAQILVDGGSSARP